LNDLIIDFCAIQSTRNLFIFKPFDVCLITLALHTSANPYYFCTLFILNRAIMNGTGEFFKSAYKFIPCQRFDGFAVVGDLFTIDFGHMLFFIPHYLTSQGDLFLFTIIGLIAAAGFYFLSQAYRLAQPSSIACFEYIAVPLSVIWGYLFFKDILEFQSIAGMILIVGSGLYIFGSTKGLTNKYILSIFKTKIRR
jgi:multidrug transporter EmrE-like cation transporter